MTINKIQLTVPTRDNPFGQLSLDVDIPFSFEDFTEYPAEADESDIVLSEESVRLLDEFRKSVIKDMTNVG